MEKKKSSTKLGISILFFEALTVLGGFIALSYIEYVYTDLAHLEVGMMTTGMTVASVLNFIVALLVGVIMQKSKGGKMGKNRRFILIGFIIAIVGGLMSAFTFGNSAIVKCVIISAGYFLYNASLDFTYNAKYSLYGRMANGDSDTLSKFTGMAYGGGNAGFVIVSLGFLSLAALLGQGNDQLGFFLSQVVFTVLVIAGVILILRASKPFEGGAVSAEEDESAQIGFLDMLKGAFANKPALTVFIAFMIKSLGYTLFNFLLVYQCVYVLNDLNLMTWALVGVSLASMLGGFLAPKASRIFGGRKKATLISYAVAAVCFILLGFFGKTIAGFLITMLLGALIISIGDSFEAPLYLDAGEYWYSKTGNDTRPFVMSLPGIGAKIYYIFVPMLSGLVLTMAHYSEESIMVGKDAAMMTGGLGFIPAAGLIIFIIILLIFHRVSDKEIEKCIAENAAKDAAVENE